MSHAGYPLRPSSTTRKHRMLIRDRPSRSVPLFALGILVPSRSLRRWAAGAMGMLVFVGCVTAARAASAVGGSDEFAALGWTVSRFGGPGRTEVRDTSGALIPSSLTERPHRHARRRQPNVE
jgi:hypothetical protein